MIKSGLYPTYIREMIQRVEDRLDHGTMVDGTLEDCIFMKDPNGTQMVTLYVSWPTPSLSPQLWGYYQQKIYKLAIDLLNNLGREQIRVQVKLVRPYGSLGWALRELARLTGVERA